jgi:hypothetical protein
MLYCTSGICTDLGIVGKQSARMETDDGDDAMGSYSKALSLSMVSSMAYVVCVVCCSCCKDLMMAVVVVDSIQNSYQCYNCRALTPEGTNFDCFCVKPLNNNE